MENGMQELLSAFKEYRDMLIPVKDSLKEMVDTYESIHTDIEKLNGTVGESISNKLNRIYESMEGQAKKSEALNNAINTFVKNSENYSGKIISAIDTFSKMQESLNELNALEEKAAEQLKKLDDIIEDRKINVNIKELSKSLDSYNLNVQKISEYINKDIASTLTRNSEELELIKQENEKTAKRLEDQGGNIAALLEELRASNALLKSAAENNDINEAYLFDALDRWAESRKLKIKK